MGLTVASINQQQFNMLSNLLRSGELVWDADQGSARYDAIISLEDAGLLSAPFVERADRFKWQVTQRGRALAARHLALSHCSGLSA